jgi:hypothetical protein
VPGLAASEQYLIKLQRDCFSDYTQLTTMPPLKVSMRRGGIEAVLGPMSQVPVREPGDIEWMAPPPFPAMGPKVVADARAALNEYFGRLSAEVPPELRQALLQKLVNTWLDTWVDAWRKGLQLLQTYMPDVEIALASGGEMRRLSRDEVRGSFRAVLKYNIADLNIEFVMKRMQAIAQLMPLDQTGAIDRNAIIRVMFRGIDPILAETGIRDTGTAREADRKDEQQALALMAQGIEPDPLTSGVNAQMRLVTLQEALQKSPVLQRRLARPADEGDEFFRKLVENRMKNLQFQVQQYQENPMIGKTGVKPV